MSVVADFACRVRRLLAALLLIVPPLITVAHAEALAVEVRSLDDIAFLKELSQQLRARLTSGGDRYRLTTGTESPQVIVTVGPTALKLALAERRSAPLLAIGIARPTFIASLEAKGMTPETVRDVCGLFVGQSPRHNLALVRALLPKAASLGVFDSPSLPVRPAFLVLAKELSLTVNAETVSSPAQALAALEPLLKKSDALLVTQGADASNNRNIRQIVLAGLLAGKPVIGGVTDGFVEEGALGAIYSRSEDIAAEALRRLELWRSMRTLGASGYARDWFIRVNPATAKTLSVVLPTESDLRSTIARLAGDE